MFARLSPALLAFGGSILLFTGMVGALVWMRTPNEVPPLEIYCAAAMRTPVEEIARDYEQEFGQPVIGHFGPSQSILVNLEFLKRGDLFMPADDSYIDVADKKGLLGRTEPVARLGAVVIVRPGLGKDIKTWDDFLNAGRIGLANPEVAAIGKLTLDHLRQAGLWTALEAKKPSYLGDVNEVGNSVANVGACDVGITYDALAAALQKKKPGLEIVKLAPLAGVEAHVRIAVVKSSKQPEPALRFIRFLRASNVLSKHGYTIWRGDGS